MLKPIYSISAMTMILQAWMAPNSNAQQRETLATLLEGPPVFAAGPLTPETYVPFDAHELAEAEVLWVNYEAFRDEGVEVPVDRIPEFKQAILRARAYAIPRADDPPGTFVNRVKTFFAGGYGGLGMDGNYGDGRRGTRGKASSKGIGVVPAMVGKTDEAHRHGRLLRDDSVIEPVFTEVAHSELTHGASRTLVVIGTKLKVRWKDGGEDKANLMVNKDFVRPAHTLSNPSVVEGRPEQIQRYQARMESIVDKIPNIYPIPASANPKNAGERMAMSFHHFIEAVAKTYAEMWARSFYHGATSPSNFMVNGGITDMGTASTIDGFPRIVFLPPDVEAANGDTEGQKRDLLKELVDDYAKTLSPAIRSYLPSYDEVTAHYDRAYEAYVLEEMIHLTGAPKELVAGIQNETRTQELARTLEMLAKAGNENVIHTDVVFEPNRAIFPTNTGKYRLDDILVTLASSRTTRVADLDLVLQHLIPENSVRDQLAAQYSAWMESLETRAKTAGISSSNLWTYLEEAAKVRNARRPTLYRDRTFAKNLKNLWTQYDQTGNPELVQNYIDHLIEENTRTFKDAAPFELVISEKRVPLQGISVRRTFDLLSGQYQQVLRLDLSQKNVSFFGNSVEKSLFLKSAPTLAVGEHARDVARGVNGRQFEFRWTADPSSAIRQIRLDIPASGQSILIRDADQLKLFHDDSCDLIMQNRQAS